MLAKVNVIGKYYWREKHRNVGPLAGERFREFVGATVAPYVEHLPIDNLT